MLRMSKNHLNNIKSDGTIKLYWIVQTSVETGEILPTLRGNGPYHSPPPDDWLSTSGQDKVICVELPFNFVSLPPETAAKSKTRRNRRRATD